jgi:two-component system, OmpR family, sensor histidine kinase BaeS
LTRPLKEVAVASRRITGGDLSVRIDAKPTTWDRQSLDLAADFNAMAGSLQRLEDERQGMIADIAHELRTPLTAIQLQLEAATDGIKPLTPDLIERLSAETAVLARLIVDLRTLSLAEAKHLSLDLEPVELCALLRAVQSSFETAATRKQIALRVEACEAVTVEADADRLRQVIGNFVSNALRHTLHGGEVALGFTRAGAGLVTIEVVDTGTGLSEAVLARAFDRFYRSETGRVRAEGGSGLGLAIAKALAELHGGSGAAENRAEGGARFTLRLPIGSEASATSTGSAVS